MHLVFAHDHKCTMCNMFTNAFIYINAYSQSQHKCLPPAVVPGMYVPPAAGVVAGKYVPPVTVAAGVSGDTVGALATGT